MASKHPGFKAVQNSIAAKEGVSKKEAGAMLAASTRKASPAAKKKNPRLSRVKGQPKSNRQKMADALRGNDHDYDDEM